MMRSVTLLLFRTVYIFQALWLLINFSVFRLRTYAKKIVIYCDDIENSWGSIMSLSDQIAD
jgi:hypothetical protein